VSTLRYSSRLEAVVKYEKLWMLALVCLLVCALTSCVDEPDTGSESGNDDDDSASTAEDCGDSIDNDGDSLTDCEDPDCSLEASCLDFCCYYGDPTTHTLCLNVAARDCVCSGAATSYCCDAGSWDTLCVDTYGGSCAANCSP